MCHQQTLDNYQMAEVVIYGHKNAAKQKVFVFLIKMFSNFFSSEVIKYFCEMTTRLYGNHDHEKPILTICFFKNTQHANVVIQSQLLHFCELSLLTFLVLTVLFKMCFLIYIRSEGSFSRLVTIIRRSITCPESNHCSPDIGRQQWLSESVIGKLSKSNIQPKRFCTI